MTGVELEHKDVRDAAVRLHQMVDQLANQRGRLVDARLRQGPGKWTGVGHCGGFAQGYGRSLDGLNQALESLTHLSGELGIALKSSARDLLASDERTAETLEAIVERAEQEVTARMVCTPYDVDPTDLEKYQYTPPPTEDLPGGGEGAGVEAAGPAEDGTGQGTGGFGASPTTDQAPTSPAPGAAAAGTSAFGASSAP